MAKYTKLQGFFNGAKQVVDYVKSTGVLITQEEYDKENAKLTKEAKTFGTDYNTPQVNAWNERRQALNARKRVSDQYQAFRNYTKQMQKYYDDKKKTFTKQDIDQLMVNNKAVQKLDMTSHRFAKYGDEGTKAISKFTRLMLENDYKKLQYVRTLPSSAVKKINMEQLSKVSLPRSKDVYEVDFDKVKRNMDKLAERMKKADANRHINSSEFRRMKKAMNELSEILSKPFGGPDSTHKYDIGEKLEALQAAAMDYVKAKGVGRQSSQLGKDRMDLALDIIGESAKGMDKFASTDRLREVREFEEKVAGGEISKRGVNEDFVYGMHGVDYEADIFKSEEEKKAEAAELDDDDDELDDDDDLDLD